MHIEGTENLQETSVQMKYYELSPYSLSLSHCTGKCSFLSQLPSSFPVRIKTIIFWDIMSCSLLIFNDYMVLHPRR